MDFDETSRKLLGKHVPMAEIELKNIVTKYFLIEKTTFF